MTLSRLSQRMDRLANVFETNVGKVVSKSALVADQRLVGDTPVDTGRARSNWLAGLNLPVSQVVDPSPVGQQTGVNVAIYSQYKPGDVIFVSNSVDYIVYLNQGSSDQAPAMFIETAVIEAVAVVKTARFLQ